MTPNPNLNLLLSAVLSMTLVSFLSLKPPFIFSLSLSLKMLKSNHIDLCYWTTEPIPMPSSISILALILAFAAILLTAAVVHCGSPASLLTLERAFPVNQRVELEVLRARDQARHGRLLRGVVGGVVDFTVYGTSDPYLVG